MIKMMVDNMINPIFISKIAGLTLTMIEAAYYSKGCHSEKLFAIVNSYGIFGL